MEKGKSNSIEFEDYVSELKRNSDSKYITFIPPDEEIGVSLKVRDELLKKSKVLVHCSRGGLHDYLEYSILDGLVFNCIPLCITSDPSQFSIVEQKRIGRVVENISEAKSALIDVLMNYESYLVNAQEFMRDFLKKQDALWLRWESTLEKICLRLG